AASTSTVSVPTSTVAEGLARRLWYQAGFVGAPPLEAKITIRPPSGMYIRGVVRRCPLLAPVLVSSRTGAPSNEPPTLPSLARNSSMIARLNSFMSGTSISLVQAGEAPGGAGSRRRTVQPQARADPARLRAQPHRQRLQLVQE